MRIPIPATANASSGAISAGTSTFEASPSPMIASGPLATNIAPTTPPTSACELLDGSPKYHVMMFQTIAPTSPAKTIVVVTTSWSTMSFAIVPATSSETNAPTKLRIAAKPTATFGAIARVEIVVATTFAVSWKPLVKSNARAVATTMTRMMLSSMRAPAPEGGPLGVLDDDAGEDVRDPLGGVDRLLEPLEEILPADHDHRV